MANTHEAADILEKLSNDLAKNYKKLNTILDHLELDGTEDTTALKDNIKSMEEILERNAKTVKYIRDTAV